MILFLMIYLGIGMVLTALAMWQIGRQYGSYTNAIKKREGHDFKFMSYYYKHSKLIEWGSYILFTILWPYFMFVE